MQKVVVIGLMEGRERDCCMVCECDRRSMQITQTAKKLAAKGILRQREERKRCWFSSCWLLPSLKLEAGVRPAGESFHVLPVNSGHRALTAFRVKHQVLPLAHPGLDRVRVETSRIHNLAS